MRMACLQIVIAIEIGTAETSAGVTSAETSAASTRTTGASELAGVEASPLRIVHRPIASLGHTRTQPPGVCRNERET